jgi:hypothetical protein
MKMRVGEKATERKVQEVDTFFNCDGFGKMYSLFLKISFNNTINTAIDLGIQKVSLFTIYEL